MRKRIGYLIVLPGISCAVTCLEVLRRHGLSILDDPAWWLLSACLIIILVLLGWCGYSRFLSRSTGIVNDKSLLIDLYCHAPLLALPLYFLPGLNYANIATYLLFASLSAFIALRLAVLVYYHPQWLAYLKNHPGGLLRFITIIGALIRISLLDRNRFHVDEALYSSWALSIASGKDIFLRFTLVDKPPVPIYVLALFFKVLGVSEVVARLPNLVASVAGIIVLYQIGKKLYGESVGLLAAVLLAASPYDIQFAPTVFNDPLMVTLTFGAVLLALNQRSLAAGLCFGLACMSKLLAWAMVPLMLVGFYASLGGLRPLKPLWRMLLMAGAGTLAVFVAVGIWDIVIRANMPRFFNVQTVNYNGLHIVSVGEFWQRLNTWIGYLQDFTGSLWLNLLLICGLAFIVIQNAYHKLRQPGMLVNLGLAGAGVLYLAPFALLSFRLYDRYLLPLAPLVILLLAWFLHQIYGFTAHWLGRLLNTRIREHGARVPQLSVVSTAKPASLLSLLLVTVLAVMLVRPVRTALAYAYPLGGDHGTFQSIETVAAYYRGNAPAGSIIYHKDLGWHYAFYLFDAPFHLVYYQDDAELPRIVTAALQRYPGVEQFLTLEQWLNHDELHAELASAGWRLVEQYRTFRPNGSLSFIVYHIEAISR